MTTVVARREFLAAGLAFAAMPGAGVSQEPSDIVATTGMIADAARVIGGDLVRVRALMGPGVDPHAYRQTRTDIVALTRADLVLSHGLYLEAQMEEFLHKLGGRRAVVAVAEDLPRSLLLGHDTYLDRLDPHVWMDPELWALVVKNVADSLVALRPEAQHTFLKNLEEYLHELDQLQRYAKDILLSVPAEKRVLITAHDAFAYFGKAYGYEVIGIQGISTESEAGLNRISELATLLAERKIASAFVETSVSDRNVRALIEGAAAQGQRVTVGGQLYSDAMGPPGSYEGTYIGMIDHNVTTISAALGGNAPMKGLNGLLGAGG